MLVVQCQTQPKRRWLETRSYVWKFFTYNKEEDTSKCLVEEDQKQCSKLLKGKFPTNLKKHLQNKHKKEFEECNTAEKAKDRGPTAIGRKRQVARPSSQETIENTINPQRYYDKQSSRHTSITKKLAIFIGATSVPISLVDNEEFRELLQEMDRKYKVPHRKVISQEISKIYSHLKEKIQCLLKEALTISICADIWSKPGMTASFLGHSICIALQDSLPLTLV